MSYHVHVVDHVNIHVNPAPVRQERQERRSTGFGLCPDVPRHRGSPGVVIQSCHVYPSYFGAMLEFSNGVIPMNWRTLKKFPTCPVRVVRF